MSGYLAEGGRMELRHRGFRDDYDVNSLQMRNGVTNNCAVMFSEIAHLAGLAYTDWSWSALFGDFDNDGYKDIVITNGYPKGTIDLDYQMEVFRARRAGDQRGALNLLKELPGYRVSNYVFRNNGDLTFTDKTTAWGMDQPGYSYGAAYADLNNDGRLDLVVNNIDAPAFIYENVAPKNDAHHYLEIKLAGGAPHRSRLGAAWILTAGGQKQYIYQSPYRGYTSTVDDRPHFGLGGATRVDSLRVVWPDRRGGIIAPVAAGPLFILQQTDAPPTASRRRHPIPHIPHPLFPPVDPRIPLR